MCILYLWCLVPLRIQSSPEKIIVKPGENAFLHCQVFGNPQPRVTWTKNGRKVVTNGRHHAFDNGTLIITTVREHDIGDYECRADNGISGSATRTVALVIKGAVLLLFLFLFFIIIIFLLFICLI